MREWLIRKIGGVPSEELDKAIKWAENEARVSRQTFASLIESEARKKDAETALERFIDKIKIDPDGVYRMDPMALPMPKVELDRRVDEMGTVVSFRVRPQVISYNMIEEFGEPEAILLAKAAQAAESIGRATAKSIKVEFGIEVARQKASGE